MIYPTRDHSTLGDKAGVMSLKPGRGHCTVARVSRPRRFPHQFAWLIDNPARRLLISPQGLAARLPLTETSQVLEIGPGSGYFTVELARLVPRGRAELLDVQAEMLTKVKRKLESRGILNVGYSKGDAGNRLPYHDEQFDVVLLVSVLGEVSDQRSCLRSLDRVLRCGGLLAFHESIPDPDRITPVQLRQLVEQHRFVFRQRWGPKWNYTAVFEKPPA